MPIALLQSSRTTYKSCMRYLKIYNGPSLVVPKIRPRLRPIVVTMVNVRNTFSIFFHTSETSENRDRTVSIHIFPLVESTRRAVVGPHRVREHLSQSPSSLSDRRLRGTSGTLCGTFKRGGGSAPFYSPLLYTRFTGETGARACIVRARMWIGDGDSPSHNERAFLARA